MAKNKLGFDFTLDEKCDIFGSMFKLLSTEYKFDSALSVRTIMTDKSLYWLFPNVDNQDWCDERFMLSQIMNRVHFTKGKVAEDYAMWFLGYLYAYWILTRGSTREEVYRILPFERFIASFEFYHTQGWDFVIDDAIKTFETNDFVI